MTEAEYIQDHYPQDFVLAGDDFFPLPKGGKMQIQNKEVSSTFTTADGTKRKDVIRRYQSATIKYQVLLEDGFRALEAIIQKIDRGFYGQRKALYIKKEMMSGMPESPVTQYFQAIEIDIVAPVKYSYPFRSAGMFVYAGVSLKIN